MAFDFDKYRLHLAQQRELQLAFPVFNPQSHPRGAAGSGSGGKFVAAGSSGQQVTAVQQKLGGGLKADGQYGPKTKAAIEAYQRAHGLQVDGIVGSQTAAALLGQKSQGPGSLTPAQLRALSGAPAATSRASSSSRATRSTKTISTTKKPPTMAVQTPGDLSKILGKTQYTPG